MKSVERHLYARNGHYYHRIGIATHLRSLLNRREFVIALGTKDLIGARVKSVQLNYEVTKAISTLQKSPTTP